MGSHPQSDFVERLAKSHMLLPIGYKEFPENPQSHDWRGLIFGLSLVPIMLLAASAWFALNRSPTSGMGFLAIAILFAVIWILPKIILWSRMRKPKDDEA